MSKKMVTEKLVLVKMVTEKLAADETIRDTNKYHVDKVTGS